MCNINYSTGLNKSQEKDCSRERYRGRKTSNRVYHEESITKGKKLTIGIGYEIIEFINKNSVVINGGFVSPTSALLYARAQASA